MSTEVENYNVRVLFEGEMAKRFEKVKRFYGLQKNADLLRLLVTMKYDELRTEDKIPEPPQSLEHFNLNEEGVLILDRTLQPDRIVQIFFKPEGPWCEHCESMKCRHVEFALDIPKVQDILREKGWKFRAQA